MLLPARFAEITARFGDHDAVVQGASRSHYAELGSRAGGVALWLRSLVHPGDRVALLMDNSADYVAACYGAWAVGAVVVALNTALKSDDLANLVRHCEASVLLADSRQKELKGLVPQLGSGVCVGVFGANGSSTWVPAGAVDLACLPPSPYRVPDGLVADDVAAIIYTSGTTGQPKGVMLSHGNLADNTASIQQYLQLSPSDRVMCVLPFFYSYGNSLLHTHISLGATLVLENSFMYPQKVLETMVKERVTGFSGVPSTYYLLLSRVDLSLFDLSCLRYCTQAGGAMDASKIAAVKRLLPQTQFFVMYGQTEASARLTYLPPARLDEKLGAVGIGIPGVDIMVCTESGTPSPVRQTGEVCARGGNIMLGYWRDAEETAKVLKDGWLHTGDLGYLDEEGYLFLVGRSKEMIKSGAHRISPREIEECISAVSGVAEVAVVGIPDELLGQAIRAFVVGSGEDLNKRIMHQCRQKLPSYKLPKDIVMVAELPKTSSGKVQKHKLQAG